MDDRLDRASQKSIVNYGFFIGATPANLPDICSATPTCGIKVFMGSAHGDLLVDTAAALEPIFACDATCTSFIENYHLIERKDIISKCGWSPFEGWNLTGYPIYTIVNGNIVYENGEIRSDIKGKALTFAGNI